MLRRLSLVMALALSAVSCGSQQASVSKTKDLGDLYVCVANNGFESKTYTKFGDSFDTGYAAAVKECYEKSGYRCTATCKDNTIDTRVDSDPSSLVWACVVKDFDTGRSWARTGATYVAARTSAEDYCVKTKAGTRCQITTCTPAG